MEKKKDREQDEYILMGKDEKRGKSEVEEVEKSVNVFAEVG